MKRIIYLLVFALVAALCSGCEGAYKSKNEQTELEVSKQPVESAPAVFIPESITKEPITATEVGITKEAFVLFQQKLAEVDISFAYEECFGMEKAGNVLAERKPVHCEAEFGLIVDGKVDVDALYASVVAQSAPYREEAAHYMYSVIENEKELMQILEFVAEAVDFYCKSATPENVGELDCILKI